MTLRHDRTVFHPESSTLFAADVHLGKAASFRAKGIPIPEAVTGSTLERLTTALQDTGANHLVFLGDLWHDKAGRAKGTVQEFSEWRTRHGEIEMTLVLGNHDAKSGTCPPEWQVNEVDEGHAFGQILGYHYPEKVAATDSHLALCGHIHPGVMLHGKGRDSMRMPCFWVRPGAIVLPPFGDLTGCCTILPEEQDWIVCVTGASLLPIASDASGLYALLEEGRFA